MVAKAGFWAGRPHTRGSLRSQLLRKLLRRKEGGDTNVIVHATAGPSCRACGARKTPQDLGATRGSLWKVCCRTFHRPRSSRCRTRWGELLSAPRVARRVVPDVDVSPGHTHRDLGTFGLTTLEANTALDALSHKPLAAE